jgi:uncharacterized lipoprotein YddW (UPF0748 family)
VLGPVLGLVLGAVWGQAQTSETPEFRGLWADAFHAGFKSSNEVRQLITDARAGHFNALLVEVRKRGDAYYESRFEPWASDIRPAPGAWDPLAQLVAEAHDTNAGPYVEVHAWIVTYNIWNQPGVWPPQPDHPFRRHPDWLTQSDTGATWDGYNYAFDPGHPEVQRHTFNVALDIVSRYAVDGLHLDHIRYAGRAWGYNPVAVARFQKWFGSSTKPATDDPRWLQFRRDQVTALVRKVYLSAMAIRPGVKISAATIAWAPGITQDQQWPATAAYAEVLQDWRAWMEEGLLDLNLPMTYFRHHTAQVNDWAQWSQFVKDHRYRRHAALGTAVYLNSVSNTLVQLQSGRVPSPNGNRADGVAVYSYAVSNSEGVPRTHFLTALTQASRDDAGSLPIFPTPTPTPVMTWKTQAVCGHLLGWVTHATNQLPLEGARLRVSGPVERALVSDATGFFGTLDLPPGRYTLTAEHPGLALQAVSLSVVAGQVATQNVVLDQPGMPFGPHDLGPIPAATAALPEARDLTPPATRQTR